MRIYKKIQTIRKKIKDMQLKKTGENKYSGFFYYELGDFLPAIIDLCEEEQLFTMVDFGEQDHVKLIIIDTEDEKGKTVEFKSSFESAVVKGAQAIQNLGATQTYMRRYLYMNAFEIAESDALDFHHGKNDKSKNKPQQQSQQKPELSTGQINRLFKIATENGYSKIENSLKNKYKISDLKYLTKEQYDAICKGFEDSPKKTKEDVKKEEQDKAKELTEELKNQDEGVDNNV